MCDDIAYFAGIIFCEFVQNFANFFTRKLIPAKFNSVEVKIKDSEPQTNLTGSYKRKGVNVNFVL